MEWDELIRKDVAEAEARNAADWAAFQAEYKQSLQARNEAAIQADIYGAQQAAYKKQYGGLQPYTRVTYNPSAGSSSRGVNPAAMSAIQKAMAYYKQGGGFGKGIEAQLGRAEKKAVTSGTQSLVSAGLSGTTMGAGLSKKFQEEVGMPTRARVEETRAQALSSLEMAKAQVIQGATEADRSRGLQEYMAQLQMMNQGSGTKPPPPVMQPASRTQQPVTSTGGAAQPYKDVPYDPVISGSSSSSSEYKPSPYANMTWQEMIEAGGVTIT